MEIWRRRVRQRTRHPVCLKNGTWDPGPWQGEQKEETSEQNAVTCPPLSIHLSPLPETPAPPRTAWSWERDGGELMPTPDISTFLPGLPGGRVSGDLPQVTTVMTVMAPGGAKNPQQEAARVDLGVENETKRFGFKF